MFEQFIRDFGYYAVFICACVEGEVAVLTAGFLCRQGLLSLETVIFVAFFGTMLTEQMLYFVGRIYGKKLLANHPKWKVKAEKVVEFLKKYDAAFIFGCRFVYGIRNISPIAIGIANIPPFKYSMLNIPAAFVWAVLVAGAGYAFADMLERARNDLQYIQYGALLFLASAMAYFLREKKMKKNRRKRNDRT